MVVENNDNSNFSEYRRLILMGLEETAAKLEGLDSKVVLNAQAIENKIHALEIKITTVETKIWAAFGVMTFVATIVGPILVAAILHFLGR